MFVGVNYIGQIYYRKKNIDTCQQSHDSWVCLLYTD